MKQKSVLFLSAIDFKEKSIQVIRKTPEAYARAGWHVEYIVARNNSKYGDYFYEREFNPEGVIVHRFYYPLISFMDKISNHTLRTIFFKILNFVAIFSLSSKAKRILKEKKFDIYYGYEVEGALAVFLLKLFRKIKKGKIITRFQGSFINSYFVNKKYFKLLLNFDQVLALYLKSDLCIMTNDGRQGDKALERVHSRNLKNYRFWVNGVDNLKISKNKINRLRHDLNIGNKFLILALSRLVSWKRIDRIIEVMNYLVNTLQYGNFICYIIGAGAMKDELVSLVDNYNITEYIVFTDAIVHDDVKNYMGIADIFLSTNDVTNVGNPLLEAIRSHKIIFTINTGDTAFWIKHRINGFIYDIHERLIENIAEDIYALMHDSSLRKSIINEIKKTEKEKLWTWEERFEAEIKEVEKIIAT